jgi:hypothetical protein
MLHFLRQARQWAVSARTHLHKPWHVVALAAYFMQAQPAASPCA